MARKKPSGDDGGGANWMDTYGDLVTNMLTFFVLLFAFSSVDSAKWEALAGAFAGQRRLVISELTYQTAVENPISLPEYRTAESPDENTDYENLMQVYGNLLGYVNENGLADTITIVVDPSRYIVTIHFSEHILFESGSSTLRPESYDTLDHVINAIATNIPRIAKIVIEGHTDNVPISTGEYRDNWDLSTSRATNALRYIESTGLIERNRLGAIGYADTRPVYPDANDTPEGRQLNRRVDFVIEALTEIRQ